MFASLTRRLALFATAILSLLVLTTSAAMAAQSSSEAFVQQNLGEAFKQLNDPGLAPAQRAERFGALMDKFADLPRIADFVVGKYSAKLRQDPALYREWRDTFREFAVTVYQGQLDQYTGERFTVTPGAKETKRNNKTYAIVATQIYRANGQVLNVDWRLISAEAGGWRVVDVALHSGESTVWLSLTQQSEFLSFLNDHNGDVRALIADVKARTSAIRGMMERRRS